MSTSTIRKAIGVVKDQTSIGLAKVSSNIAPELDVAIVKATSHDDEPADEKHIREILRLTSSSHGYVSACVATLSRRLGKTRDWIVSLKILMLVHRLIADGDPAFYDELLYATRRGTRLLNLSDFRDEAHSSSWDHSAFVRTYALYLDQRLDCIIHDRKQSQNSPREDRQRRSPDRYGSGSYGRYSNSYTYSSPPQSEEKKTTTPLRELNPEKLLFRLHDSLLLFDRFLACRPAGLAKNSRMVFVALYPIIRESFHLYASVCEILAVLMDRFFDMEYVDCVKFFQAYSRSAKQIDELVLFYAWSKDTGVARSSEYPDVQRISAKLLETLEELLKERERRQKGPPVEEAPLPALEEKEPEQDMNSIKALPAPSDCVEPAPAEEEPKPEITAPQPQGDLVDLREDVSTAEAQENKLALALFSTGTNTGESFPSSAASTKGEQTSAWQTPAAEQGKADWELALVETASNLAKQKASLGGGFDPLLLNGMYDQGAVTQHLNAKAATGSASSVALPGPGKATTPVLALPAPDGTLQNVGGDPFSASCSIPPPPYVQMADIEKKQQLLVQEQKMWHQYTVDGMQGQASLARLSNAYYYLNPALQYGIPPTTAYHPNM